MPRAPRCRSSSTKTCCRRCRRRSANTRPPTKPRSRRSWPRPSSRHWAGRGPGDDAKGQGPGYYSEGDFLAKRIYKPGVYAIPYEGKELVIRFDYRPATVTDWPEDSRAGKSKPPAQKDLSALAAKRVLAVTHASLTPWIAELGKPHVTTSGEKADYTRLEAHLKRYTARNTFDYFIKNEVMHLDDVKSETAPRVEQYLSKIKVIRKIAGKIFAFLAQPGRARFRTFGCQRATV